MGAPLVSIHRDSCPAADEPAMTIAEILLKMPRAGAQRNG